jgi:hypothetical protein
MSANKMMPKHEDVRELETVSGGRLAAVVVNIINKIAWEVRGGDYSSTGISASCAGPG